MTIRRTYIVFQLPGNCSRWVGRLSDLFCQPRPHIVSIRIPFHSCNLEPSSPKTAYISEANKYNKAFPSEKGEMRKYLKVKLYTIRMQC